MQQLLALQIVFSFLLLLSSFLLPLFFSEIEELRAENDELQTDLANSLKENQDLNNEYSWMRGGRGL